MSNKVVALCSGGLDSTVMLHQLLDRDFVISFAISFDYGQKHVNEILFAERSCKSLGIPLLRTELKLPYSKIALMGDAEIPDGHYTDESMTQTIVPNRNAIMLSIAWGVAVNIDANYVAMAVHGGDHPIYPDCRRDFIGKVEEAFQSGTESNIKMLTPFVSVDKTEIVRVGNKLGVNFNRTWSCYKGGAIHCGKCGTCTERKEAFELAEVSDPTFYEE